MKFNGILIMLNKSKYWVASSGNDMQLFSALCHIRSGFYERGILKKILFLCSFNIIKQSNNLAIALRIWESKGTAHIGHCSLLSAVTRWSLFVKSSVISALQFTQLNAAIDKSSTGIRVYVCSVIASPYAGVVVNARSLPVRCL